MSISLSGGLCGGGGRIESLHAGNLYLNCLEWGSSSKDGVDVGRGLIYTLL